MTGRTCVRLLMDSWWGTEACVRRERALPVWSILRGYYELAGY